MRTHRAAKVTSIDGELFEGEGGAQETYLAMPVPSLPRRAMQLLDPSSLRSLGMT